MKKIYLATPISTEGEKKWSKKLAKKIRELGYEVYAAADNDSINDKSNNPTPRDIYVADIDQIKKADIVVCNITGGLADGTISEIGFVGGWNSVNRDNPKKIIDFSSNERLNQPQFYKGIASAGANHLVLGIVDKEGIFVGNTSELLEYLRGMTMTKKKEQTIENLLAENKNLKQENFELKLYRKALHKWDNLQVLMLFEEMAELQKEITKNIRGVENRKEIAEEIADVEIMLAQMKLYYGVSEGVERFKKYKLQRLEDRLVKNNGK